MSSLNSVNMNNTSSLNFSNENVDILGRLDMQLKNMNFTQLTDSMEQVATLFSSTESSNIDSDRFDTLNGSIPLSRFNGTRFNSSYITCDSSVVQYNIVPALILAGCCIFGIMYCLFGYRFFKATMFITGFLFGSCVVFFFMFEVPIIPTAAKIGSAVGAGLLCGIVAMLLPRIGLLLTGCTAGILIAIGVFVVIELFYHITIRWIPIGCSLGLGAILGLITMIAWHRALIIASTAVIGSALIISAIDYYIDLFRASLYAYDRLTARQSGLSMPLEDGWEFVGEPMCWFSWIFYAVWPAAVIVSFIFQWVTTAEEEKNKRASNKEEALLRPGTRRQGREDRPESQGEQYRHLYKVRRANGDVVSKSYMQSIHNQLSPSLRLLTPLPSDNIPDDNSIMLSQTPEIDS